jgi:RNA-directed DNA polymerase
VYDGPTRLLLATELADAFLGSAWRAELVAESGAGCLDRWPGWMDALSLSVVAAYRSPPADDHSSLVTFIERFLARRRDGGEESEPPQVLRRQARQAARPPSQPGHDWPVAVIPSVAALAETLELSEGQLAWLADVRSLECSVAEEKLRNYRYRIVPRPAGLARVIEAPKARLKEVQRWILREILDHVPPHQAAHGFAGGRSAVTAARMHTGREAVLHLDLKDFFASIAAGRVYGIFRTAGYKPVVAHVLTGICTNAVPLSVWDRVPRASELRTIQAHFWLGRQLVTPHLPQGAPTSPALANLAAFRLDRRLSGLAAASGLGYSRYADDMTFSGSAELTRRRRHLEDLIARIVAEEGFALNRDKSALSTSASRQSVCGVVVNSHPNVTRGEYERLKAILHNAARLGPASQNRARMEHFEAHLRGRVSWVSAVNPRRGEKLRRRFAEIDWNL